MGAGIVAASGVPANNIKAQCSTLNRRLAGGRRLADSWNAEISVPIGGDAGAVSANLKKSGENGVLMNTIKATAKASGVLTKNLAKANPVVEIAPQVTKVTRTVQRVVSENDPTTSTPTKAPTKKSAAEIAKPTTKTPTSCSKTPEDSCPTDHHCQPDHAKTIKTGANKGCTKNSDMSMMDQLKKTVKDTSESCDSGTAPGSAAKRGGSAGVGYHHTQHT